MTNQQKKQYQAINLRTSIPYKAGYTFIGWKTGNTVYQPGERYDEEQSMTIIRYLEKAGGYFGWQTGSGKPCFVCSYRGRYRYETALKAADALKKSLDVDKFSDIIVADGNKLSGCAGRKLSCKGEEGAAHPCGSQRSKRKMIENTSRKTYRREEPFIFWAEAMS